MRCAKFRKATLDGECLKIKNLYGQCHEVEKTHDGCVPLDSLTVVLKEYLRRKSHPPRMNSSALGRYTSLARLVNIVMLTGAKNSNGKRTCMMHGPGAGGGRTSLAGISE